MQNKLTFAIALTLLFPALGTGAAQPTLTHDRIMYRAFSREARQKKFLAKLEWGATQTKLKLAIKNEKRVSDLFNTGAASGYEATEAIMAFLEARFEEQRASFHVEEFTERERLWDFRANVEKETKESLVRFAEGIASIYRKRVALLTTLDSELKGYVEKLDERLKAEQKLFNNRPKGTTAEKLEKTKAHHGDGVGLAEAVAIELAASKDELIEAEADVEAAKKTK